MWLGFKITTLLAFLASGNIANVYGSNTNTPSITKCTKRRSRTFDNRGQSDPSPTSIRLKTPETGKLNWTAIVTKLCEPLPGTSHIHVKICDNETLKMDTLQSRITKFDQENEKSLNLDDLHLFGQSSRELRDAVRERSAKTTLRGVIRKSHIIYTDYPITFNAIMGAVNALRTFILNVEWMEAQMCKRVLYADKGASVAMEELSHLIMSPELWPQSEGTVMQKIEPVNRNMQKILSIFCGFMETRYYKPEHILAFRHTIFMCDLIPIIYKFLSDLRPAARVAIEKKMKEFIFKENTPPTHMCVIVLQLMYLLNEEYPITHKTYNPEWGQLLAEISSAVSNAANEILDFEAKAHAIDSSNKLCERRHRELLKLIRILKDDEETSVPSTPAGAQFVAQLKSFRESCEKCLYAVEPTCLQHVHLHCPPETSKFQFYNYPRVEQQYPMKSPYLPHDYQPADQVDFILSSTPPYWRQVQHQLERSDLLHAYTVMNRSLHTEELHNDKHIAHLEILLRRLGDLVSISVSRILQFLRLNIPSDNENSRFDDISALTAFLDGVYKSMAPVQQNEPIAGLAEVKAMLEIIENSNISEGLCPNLGTSLGPGFQADTNTLIDDLMTKEDYDLFRSIPRLVELVTNIWDEWEKTHRRVTQVYLQTLVLNLKMEGVPEDFSKLEATAGFRKNVFPCEHRGSLQILFILSGLYGKSYFDSFLTMTNFLSNEGGRESPEKAEQTDQCANEDASNSSPPTCEVELHAEEKNPANDGDISTLREDNRTSPKDAEFDGYGADQWEQQFLDLANFSDNENVNTAFDAYVSDNSDDGSWGDGTVKSEED